MINLHKEKQRATVHFICGGETIPMLDREINFTTVAGAKRALVRIIGSHIDNLRRFYGYGKRVNVEAIIIGNDVPFMTTSINI